MESLPASRRNQILALLAVAQLMGVLDFSIVNVALPSIQRMFHLAPADLQWAVSAYALVFGGFLLLGGRAADLFDRKRVFMLGLGLFSLASLAGAFLLTGAIVSRVLALSQMASPEAGMVQVLLPGLLAVVLGVIFIVVERRSQHPLVPLSVFRRRSLSVANLMALLTIAIASLLAFTLTLYLQSVLGFSPMVTGLAFLPAGVGGIAGGQIATRAIRRMELPGASALGPGLIALGSVLLTRITPAGGVVWVVVGYLIAGVGIVCTVVTTTIAATAHLGPELQGLAAGLLNTAQQVGAALGISLASVVATSIALAAGGAPVVAATTGYQATLYLALGLSVITATLTLLADEPAPRSPSIRAHRPVSNT